MTFFLVLTKPRVEIATDDRLRALGCDTVCLRYWTTVRHARREKRVLRPYFPRYIMVAGNMGEIRQTPGVSDLARNSDGLLSVPDTVVDELRARGDEAQIVGITEERARERFREGQKVRVRDGPFVGFLAIVAIDSGPAVRAWLEGFRGGRVLTTFGAEALEPVSP